MRAPVRVALCGIFLTVGLSVSACSPKATVTVVPDPEVETTGTITPLERGKIRRDVEAAAQEAVDAWLNGDRDTVEEHFATDARTLLFQRWDEADEQGQTVERSHELISIDAIEMNDYGTQALVKYRFTDNTVVRNPDGSVALSRDGEESDMQFTMEPESEGSDSWIVVRMVGTTDSIR